MNIDNILKMTEGMTAIQHKIFYSLAALALLWLIKFLIRRLLWSRSEDIAARYRWGKLTDYIFVSFFLLVLLLIWIDASWSFFNIFSLTAAALVLALQDLIRSIAGWFYLIWRRPFFLGDRIQIGEAIGDVIDIGVLTFSINEVGNWVKADQSTGRVVHLPNSLLLTANVANFTEGFPYIWDEIPVLITFESNWRSAKQILTSIAAENSDVVGANAQRKLKEASKKYMIFYRKLTPIVYTYVRDCGVELTMRFLVEPRRRRSAEEAIWEQILAAFELHEDIDFAYPTTRFYTSEK